MGVHDGHRQRLKKRFLAEGLDNFETHEVLELLLYFSIPQGDVNPLAHRLLSRFGSLAGVCDAKYDDLLAQTGVGESTAVLLNLIPQLTRLYALSRADPGPVIQGVSDAGNFLLPYFHGEREEVVYAVGLDGKGKVLSVRLLAKGSLHSASFSTRQVVEYALSINASAILLAHNHPSGVAIPSEEDEMATSRLYEALAYLDITLVDHLVVAEDDFVSLQDNGFFARLAKQNAQKNQAVWGRYIKARNR